MKKLLIFIFLLASFPAICAAAVGDSSSTPGYSAKDILNQNLLATDGAYWIDPDLPGGDVPFQVYADMTTDGV